MTRRYHPGARMRDDAGQVAGIEVLPFGFLILVVGSLLLANAWAVVDTKMAVTSAAREATRRYVEAPDGQVAEEEARRAARDALDGQGVTAREEVRVAITAEPWGRCARVVIEVEVDVPAVGLPFIGGFGRTFEVAARHSEIVDPYRSGVAGEVSCGG